MAQLSLSNREPGKGSERGRLGIRLGFEKPTLALQEGWGKEESSVGGSGREATVMEVGEAV